MTGRHLVVMAAGTGGHILPGLAVAREMQHRGWTVSWLGTPGGMEHKLVTPESGIPLDTIAFTGLRGKGFMHAMTGGFRLLGAFGQCLKLLKHRAATAVFGTGGYVCFPGGLMASALGKPLVLMNADAALLLSNRALKPVADRIAFGFDGAAAATTKRGIVTGNPVRAEIEALPAPAERYAGREGPLRVLVVGGSLGAKVLNETLPAALALLEARERPLVIHQTGATQRDAVKATYATLGLDPEGRGIEVLPFIDDMPSRLAHADLVICRAGAVTVSELCAAGVASILVPLVVSTTSHQRDNAQLLAQHGAAIHLPQGELTPQAVADRLRALDRVELLAMAEKARALSRPRAAARVADEIERLVA
ncbi:MAG TPA: undecaprenyldiphospho-muramoylpentapeptide beta-N-acetylglucosaminyltransferase [Methylibium sp.]|uniref:undecaprenyldiphospho-muramoylpentapeptide beta-N-acetylglucosaminyltransferase n=1 Tax=Methylibium sp. TaxID=2067992 RepID=UPI002DBD97D8|nr:undecaprenyldiphospho-muramoylpentapeptide beta-N-acetylglucosaminyltransferase [Methylibium sp.]HEU4460592.1 undecaprenyldiphospho-muramoylpentapeptide beta-N-acetylglucosaminyltransferase [Methylibium sp.]